MKLFFRKKSWGLASVAIAASCVLFTPCALADENTQILTNIQTDTDAMLVIINQLPTFLTKMTNLATTLLASDDSGTDPVNWSTNWTNQQTWLSTLGTNALNNEANQITLQQSLLTTFFGSSNIAGGNPQYLNDLSYTTLLGQPLLSPDPRSGANAAMNYLTNASGLSIKFPVPGSGWRGNQTAQQNYLSFFTTVTAVQTYNAYVLSRLYEDSQTLTNDTSLRKQLITQSSNANWFTSVITNDLGWVLRQILLYSSQTYVLMDQLLQTQKQMAATLAMTNSLLIANSNFQAQALLSKAQGTGG